MTRPNVHCTSTLPTAHETEPARSTADSASGPSRLDIARQPVETTTPPSNAA